MDADRAPDRSRALPLTERVLARLPGPRWLLITLWSVVPLLSPLIFSGTVRLSGQPFSDPELTNLLATQAVLAYVVFVLLWGTGRLGSQAEALRPDISRLYTGEAPAGLFAGSGSTMGPLVLAATVTAASSAYAWSRYGPLPPLFTLPLLFTYTVAILTFVWVYLTILVDLDRLGRSSLALEGFPHDRTLGLGGVGSLASTGFGFILLAAVPLLLAASDEPMTLGISLAIVAVTVAAFVLSMWRLHRQMAASRARALALTRALYATAFEPLRAQPGTEVLERQASALGAAKALDERAQTILTWPVDEGTLRFLAVVVTGVVTSLVVRGLFAAVGF